jgi:hypothetical protein
MVAMWGAWFAGTAFLASQALAYGPLAAAVVVVVVLAMGVRLDRETRA